MRAREANALDSLDGVTCAQELAELRPDLRQQVAPPRVDVLPEQRELAHPLAGELRHLGEHVARAAADLASAHRGNDAVRARRVAAHRDLHPRLKAALAVHRQRGGELTLLSGAPHAARHAEPTGAEPLAEMRDRPRAESDVDVGVKREEPVALRLRVTAADGDDRVGLRALLRGCVPHVCRELRVGLLADRAGVEHDHVRLFPAPSLSEPELLEHALDALRVVGVHLAAERGDVIAAHRPLG